MLRASRATGSTTTVRTGEPTASRTHRGHGQGRGSATSAASPSARATARSTPSTPRCGRALDGRYPALEHDPPHRLQGPGARRRRRHRRGRAGAHRLDRRRANLDHHRASAPTSSRRRGRRSSTPSSSASSATEDASVPRADGRPGVRARQARLRRGPHLRVAAAPARLVAGRPPRRPRGRPAPGDAARHARAPTRATPSSWPTTCSGRKLKPAPVEHADDAVAGCLGVALKRAVALRPGAGRPRPDGSRSRSGASSTRSPDAELVELREALFAEVAHPHHYAESAADRRRRARRRACARDVADADDRVPIPVDRRRRLPAGSAGS